MDNAEKQRLAENNKHISTEEIIKDIFDTEKEINRYEEEKAILMNYPQENRPRIYLLEGRISRRRYFINELEAILEVRGKL